MSTDCQPTTAVITTAIEVSPSPGRRRVDHIDEPARPLGAKRAALRLRRQRSASPRVARTTPPVDAGTRALTSKDGTVDFVMRASAGGLLVERTQRRTVGARLVQVMVFTDPPTFDRWCDSEPMRFEDPVLYDQLRREGHEALGGKR